MLSLFANPFTMIVGALLISSPIIIHLINRMRYRRVRWAAMEFLLKSQKRSRRKLIIEQMILLALRILMVLLVGLLLARFLGCEEARALFEAEHEKMRPVLHVVGDFRAVDWGDRTKETLGQGFEELKTMQVEM